MIDIQELTKEELKERIRMLGFKISRASRHMPNTMVILIFLRKDLQTELETRL